MSEFSLIDVIRSECALHRPDVLLGIGDDAASIQAPPDQELLVCTDTLIAGRHFPLNTRPEHIGWKSLAVNLSDLAAMGAEPAFALLALSLPESDEAWVRAFAQGFSELATRHGVALIGGDTTRGALSITVTAMGFAPRGTALKRSGAKPGDVIAVCGALGRAAAGLHYLKGHPDCGRAYRLDPHRLGHQWVRHLDRPPPQIAQGMALRAHASSAIDISDGLAADLGHILKASGVGADIALASIPGWEELREELDQDAATQHVLAGGDDYVLLVTVPPDRLDAARAALSAVDATLYTIGHIASDPGLRVRDAAGNIVEPATHGWDHFA
jgi:thiamine-monophosphate kinase